MTFRTIHNHCEKAVSREESLSKCSQGSSARIKVTVSEQSLDMTSSLEKGSQSSGNSRKKSFHGKGGIFAHAKPLTGVENKGKVVGGTRPRVMTKTSFLDNGNQELDNPVEAVSNNLKVPSTSKEDVLSIPGK